VARIVVIGNTAGGKSTLARHLAHRRELPLIEGGPAALAARPATEAGS
jgi:adenylate kinase family enzyme